MSSGRRRPGIRGPAVLLLAGTLSLGVGVVLHVYDGDDRALVAQDVGTLPGSSAASAGGAARPPSAVIPVLAGLDDPAPQAAPVGGGFDPPAPPASPVPPTTPAEPEPLVPPAPPTAPEPVAPPAPPRRELGPVLTDPTLDFPPPPPSPRALAPAPPSLAAQEPGLVSPLYPLPDPPSSVARTPVVPAQLDLPARSVTASVDAVGTDPSGGMVVPEQVSTVGWWSPGVLPGGPAGSAVIAGHVDSRTQGVGVMAVLPQLTEGEPVLVRDATGRTATFRVAARREYAKFDLPRAVFRRDGAPQLVLITCGGRFDPAARSYESNIVVYAVPA